MQETDAGPWRKFDELSSPENSRSWGLRCDEVPGSGIPPRTIPVLEQEGLRPFGQGIHSKAARKRERVVGTRQIQPNAIPRALDVVFGDFTDNGQRPSARHFLAWNRDRIFIDPIV
jgi:hypothetical protein